jgi:hypothetical protein
VVFDTEGGTKAEGVREWGADEDIWAWEKRSDRGWRTLHNEELNDLYSSVRVIQSRRMRWAGHVARMGEGRGAYRILVGRPEGRRPLGRPRSRWEYNIKMDLQNVGWGMD